MTGYVCVAVGFPRHRKTLRLFKHIGERAFWIPTFLWLYAAENQRNGDFSDYNGDDIARVLSLPPQDGPGVLSALKATGFLNSKGKIHDWKSWNKFFATPDRFKKAQEARWREVEAVYKANGLTREQWFDLPRPERRLLITNYRASKAGNAAAAPGTVTPTAAEPKPGQMMVWRERKKAIAEQMESHPGNPKSRAFDAADKIAASAFRALKRDFDSLTEKLSGHTKCTKPKS